MTAYDARDGFQRISTTGQLNIKETAEIIIKNSSIKLFVKVKSLK